MCIIPYFFDIHRLLFENGEDNAWEIYLSIYDLFLHFAKKLSLEYESSKKHAWLVRYTTNVFEGAFVCEG